MIRVLIFDGHTIVHRALRQILAEEPDMMVAGVARTGQEALTLAQTRPWDVVVLDLSMPGRDGLDVLKKLKQLHPKLPILVLSMYPEEQYAIRALMLGASGYMTKESAPEELIGAIRRIVMGGRYLSPAMAETLAGRMVGVNPVGKRPLHDGRNARDLATFYDVSSIHGE